MNKLYLIARLIGMLLVSTASSSNFGKGSAYAQLKENNDSIQYIGVNIRGYYTSSTPFPDHYYDDSFKLISQERAISSFDFEGS